MLLRSHFAVVPAYGSQMWCIIMLLALIAPPTILWLKSREWRFGCSLLPVAIAAAAVSCRFMLDDLNHLDALWRLVRLRPLEVMMWVLLPSTLVASMSALISVVLMNYWRGR